ncbi:geobacillin-26 family protein [Methanorbis rubei]|uniref:Uncharacterized protein n=1 Tax=Methanorbis rubei TaxID=3028300 RepID=A0AAE4SC16_9EURY|nr:hypothetical protein [Methanocorpusculaceae archaeon Cs1]
MKKTKMKTITVMICLCLIFSLFPGVFAQEPTVNQTFTYEGITYAVDISYTSTGERVSTVTGGGTISTSVFYPSNNTVILEEKYIDTGISTVIIISDEQQISSYPNSLSTLSIQADSFSGSSLWFGVRYTFYPGNKLWEISNTDRVGKVCFENAQNTADLNGFKEAVDSCLLAEAAFAATASAADLALVPVGIGALTGVGIGIGALVSAVTAAGMGLAAAIALVQAYIAAQDANYHYARV